MTNARIEALEALVARLALKADAVLASQNVQFGHVNLAAGLTDHIINWGGVAVVDGECQFVAPRPGYIAYCSANLSEAAAGDNLTLDVFHNGVDIAEFAILVGQTSAYRNYAPGAYPFAAGDLISARITTPAGWTAVTADLGVSIGFVFTS